MPRSYGEKRKQAEYKEGTSWFNLCTEIVGMLHCTMNVHNTWQQMHCSWKKLHFLLQKTRATNFSLNFLKDPRHGFGQQLGCCLKEFRWKNDWFLPERYSFRYCMCYERQWSEIQIHEPQLLWWKIKQEVSFYETAPPYFKCSVC